MFTVIMVFSSMKELFLSRSKTISFSAPLIFISDRNRVQVYHFLTKQYFYQFSKGASL